MFAVGAIRKEPHNANITPQNAAFDDVYQMFRATLSLSLSGMGGFGGSVLTT